MTTEEELEEQERYENCSCDICGQDPQDPAERLYIFQFGECYQCSDEEKNQL